MVIGFDVSIDNRIQLGVLHVLGKTMPNYKLTYFGFRGRGELIRFLFAAAGVQYEENTIEGSAWPELKPSKLTENANLALQPEHCIVRGQRAKSPESNEVYQF